MDEPSAQRTLVKSPPELWAEVSDLDALARHLGEFGEIRITRLEPETTVAWEGARARGTVRLEPSGWGTRVTLTAALAEPPAPEPIPIVPEPEPAPPPMAAEAEPVAAVPDPDPEPVAAVAPSPRPSLLARLLGRRAPQPAAQTPEPVEPEPDVIEPLPEPVPLRPEPPPEPPPAAAEAEPTPDGQLDPTRATEILSRVLDDLGAAHHRPFSRA